MHDFAEVAGNVLLLSLLFLTGGMVLWLTDGRPGNWGFGVLLGVAIGIAGVLRYLLSSRRSRTKATVGGDARPA
jgi:hypothetical protein